MTYLTRICMQYNFVCLKIPMNFFVVVYLFVPVLGIDIHRVKRVMTFRFNDTLAKIEDYPCMVSLFKITKQEQTGDFIDVQSQTSTGTLITSEWLLTTKKAAGLVEADYGEGWKVVGGNICNTGQFNLNDTYANYTSMQHYHEGSDLDKDELTLCKFSPRFLNSAKIKPAKLPPDKQFVKKCKKVTLVGWGSSYRSPETAPDETPYSQSLRKIDAKVVKCTHNGTRYFDTIYKNQFCVKPDDASMTFCNNEFGWDSALAVLCEDVLIGIVQEPYGDSDGSDCAKIAYATDVSQYLTWLHKVTGVQVAYESAPFYGTPTTTLTTKFMPRFGITTPTFHFEIRWTIVTENITIESIAPRNTKPTFILILTALIVQFIIMKIKIN